MKYVRITHKPSGLPLAEGPLGWGITPFEGNFYIGRKYLKTDRFRPNFLPGLCIYKFLYVWMDLHLDEGRRVRNLGVWMDLHLDNGGIFRNLGWLYWLPNPLMPFIWYRVAVPRSHPEILVEEYEQ